MLNGKTPLMIITYKTAVGGGGPLDLSITNWIGSMNPLIPGIPIPLYLDDSNSIISVRGIHIASESKNIDIHTEAYSPVVANEKKEMLVRQKGLNSSISVEMEARKDSPVLMILMALCDKIYERVGYDGYRVDYFNGAITLFDAKFNSLSVTPGRGDNMFNINMTLNYTTAEPKSEEASGDTGGVKPPEPKKDAGTLGSGVA